jgi:DUF1009 family protein
MAPKLGIVAGGGDVPARIAAACERAGREVYILGLEGQADPDTLAADAWIRFGEVGKGLDLLRGARVEELTIVGRVARPSLRQLRPDAWSARFLAKAGKAVLGDDSVLSALAREIEREGFRIIAPETILDDLLAIEGSYGGLAPDALAAADIERGVDVALALGAADVGQAVIVQQGHVLGVEAAEGTDRLIERCGALRLEGEGGVLVKLAKPGQDRRMDLPTIGAGTVERARAAGLRGIAIEAGGALIVDPDAVTGAADRSGLFVIAIAVDR